MEIQQTRAYQPLFFLSEGRLGKLCYEQTICTQVVKSDLLIGVKLKHVLTMGEKSPGVRTPLYKDTNIVPNDCCRICRIYVKISGRSKINVFSQFLFFWGTTALGRVMQHNKPLRFGMYFQRFLLAQQTYIFGYLNVPNSNPLGIKRFVSGISISFKCECHIIMQMQYTKNLIPGRFELGTTLSQPNR